jgi:hypothetical protein
MTAGRADGKILGANGPHFAEFGRVLPDIDELLPTHIPARQRKLHAGKHIAVRGDIGGGVAGAARESLQNVTPHRRRRSAKLFDIADQLFIVKHLIQLGA